MGLSQGLIREIFDYNPDTGILTNRVTRSSGAIKGKVAGCANSPYLNVTVNGESHGVHSIVWLYVHGYLPETDIDHINHDKRDNRIGNLREVSRQCNQRNRLTGKNSKSGVKGVSWSDTTKVWMAHIMVGGKSIWLGNSKDLVEAVCLRLVGEQAENWHGCDTSSPAFLYVTNNIKK